MLSSLPDDDYETFFLTLINGKQSLSCNEVSVALVKLKRKDNESPNGTSTEALIIRGRSFNQKGKSDCKRLKFRSDLKKNQCDFCKEQGL